MEKYRVIIIGGGASGIMCALNTKQSTLLIEAGERLGKKILATGNGKCNLTNDFVSDVNYNTPLVVPFLQRFNQLETLKYFEQLGVHSYADIEGRRYPLSNSANTVLDLMLLALQRKRNVKVCVNAIPLKIVATNDGFSVITNDKTYYGDKLVLATGGNSGTQYLQQLKINYQSFRPSLVGLKTNRNKGLAGVRVSNVRVKFQTFNEVGEVLFKEDGLSGIVVFNLSAYMARRQIKSGTIYLDLLAQVPTNNLRNMLQISFDYHPDYFLTEILTGILHKSLAKNLVEKLSLTQVKTQDCSEQTIDDLVNLIKNYPVMMQGYADNYQVHTGGVNLDDLDEHLQHRQMKNLFFAGEIINVDGNCGGYNLQWAWTSGKIVADSLC